jgi:hypothetical protein
MQRSRLTDGSPSAARCPPTLGGSVSGVATRRLGDVIDVYSDKLTPWYQPQS